MSTGRAVLLVALLAAACAAEREDDARAPHESSVPGLGTSVVIVAPVRDVVRGFAAVSAEGDPPEVRDARAALVEAEARLTLAMQQVERLTALARGAVAPRKELEAAHAEAASATAGAARARQVLAAFGSGAGGRVLAADETWAVANVLQRDVAAVAGGAEARFAADAFSARSFPARVDDAPAYVDPTTRLAPVRLRVHDPERVLRPGMTGSAIIEVGTPRLATTVPPEAVVYDGPQPVVFVAEDGGRYVPHPVRLGVERDGKVEVVTGVDAGVRVVTTGAASLLSAARLPADAEAD